MFCIDLAAQRPSKRQLSKRNIQIFPPHSNKRDLERAFFFFFLHSSVRVISDRVVHEAEPRVHSDVEYST